MRNLFISKEVRISDLAPRNDAVAITANPFAKEVFVLYESGLLIGVQESSCEVGLDQERYQLRSSSSAIWRSISRNSEAMNSPLLVSPLWLKWNHSLW